jgi:hypothetical protein
MNRKYGFDGTLFKGRFKSEPVEDEGQLYELIRYIHQNPQWHRLVEDLDDYRYSSWHEYVGGESRLPNLCSRPEGLAPMTEGKLRDFLSAPLSADTYFIESTEPSKPKPSDAQVWILTMKMAGVNNRRDFQRLPDGTRRETLSNLRKQGASVRQLEKLTGVGRGVIQNL